MFDINLNFSGIFSNCFSFKKKQDDILPIIKTLNTINEKNQKIQIILQKIVNGINDLAIIWKITENGDHRIYNHFGKLDENKITHYRMTNIPVYNHNKMSYYIMVFKEIKKGLVVNDDLVELLIGILLKK